MVSNHNPRCSSRHVLCWLRSTDLGVGCRTCGQTVHTRSTWWRVGPSRQASSCSLAFCTTWVRIICTAWLSTKQAAAGECCSKHCACISQHLAFAPTLSLSVVNHTEVARCCAGSLPFTSRGWFRRCARAFARCCWSSASSARAATLLPR